MPPEPPPSALRLRLDEQALVENWRVLGRMSGSARTGAAIKADAYGLGARQVAPLLRAAGCEDFFVAHWGEAAQLLDLLDPASIAVLHGPLNAADMQFAMASGVCPVINSLHQAQRWLDAGGGACHLMVDTGINRLGLPMADLGSPLIGRLAIDILLSHLASADEDSPQNEAQRRLWQTARETVQHRRASLANSAGIALGSAYHGDLTRPGLALYGGVPGPAFEGLIRQVAWPEAAIMQVREIGAGDSIGYSAKFTATAPMRVGVISLGYADGYLRCWSGQGRFVAGGVILPVLGRVSMDMTVIDLSAAPQLDEGDWVGASYALPAAAQATGLSQYELLTLLGRRFVR